MKKLIFLTLIIFTCSFKAFADNSHFINFNKVLNSSKPGSEAQKKLREKVQVETKKYKKLEENIRKEESDIISQKKVLSPEDYKKKVQSLRKRVADLQRNKKSSFANIGKDRNDARNALLKALKPILKNYMEKNNIRMIIDKQSVILGDSTLEITDQIIAIVNKEVSSLKLK